MKPTAGQKGSEAATVRPTRMDLAPGAIVPDDKNRRIEEDEDFQSLLDSIRVLGVLKAVDVQDLGEGIYRLVDGERRWLAAQKAALGSIPADVWPANTPEATIKMAAIAMNEERKAFGCLHVARGLRDLKRSFGDVSHEVVARRMGMPVDRVKQYFALLTASDALFDFFERSDVPLRVALEFVRYEKSTNEAAARRLLARHKQTPLTVSEIIALRRRQEAPRRENIARHEAAAGASPKRPVIAGRLAKAIARDTEGILAEVRSVLEPLGYCISVKAETPR